MLCGLWGQKCLQWISYGRDQGLLLVIVFCCGPRPSGIQREGRREHSLADGVLESVGLLLSPPPQRNFLGLGIEELFWKLSDFLGSEFRRCCLQGEEGLRRHLLPFSPSSLAPPLLPPLSSPLQFSCHTVLHQYLQDSSTTEMLFL